MDLGWVAMMPWYGWGAMVAVVSLILWQYERVAVLLGRRVPRRTADNDTVMWRAGDVFASGLSVAIVIIDYGLKIRIYNRGAEDLTGYPFHSVSERSFGLLLPDDERDSFSGHLDRYLKDFRQGDAVQWIGEERDMTLIRQDESPLPVKAMLTHFGNGHGGIQIELRPAVA